MRNVLKKKKETRIDQYELAARASSTECVYFFSDERKCFSAASQKQLPSRRVHVIRQDLFAVYSTTKNGLSLGNGVPNTAEEEKLEEKGSFLLDL